MSATRIGFMQGRLSAQVDGKIQAFPWEHWRDEFRLAEKNGFGLMEWTLDQDRLDENPLMTVPGRQEIRELSAKHRLRVLSLTGDCFMQAPFYKAEGARREALLGDLKRICQACGEVGIRFVLIPLVDNGSLENVGHEESLREGLHSIIPTLRKTGTKIVFESDFAPKRLAAFIDTFDKDFFGINFDMGNSASLGFDAREELEAFGHRVLNVHVKDRVLGGTTVPLGTGNAKLPVVFELLKKIGYSGNFILQTARAKDGDHAGALCRYRELALGWLG